MQKVCSFMTIAKLTRTGTALAAGAALFAAASTCAFAAPSTFDVSTTIAASCVVTDGGPGDLTPSYVPSTDTSTGAGTFLETNCNSASPLAVFTDFADTGSTRFVMTSAAGNNLYYQISNNDTCSGGPGDDPIVEGAGQTITTGNNSYAICAAVIVGGLNTGVAAGIYSDTVTYTVAP
jgi:hypothetical protein